MKGKLFRVDVPILNRAVVVVHDCDGMTAQNLIYEYLKKTVKQPTDNVVDLGIAPLALGRVRLHDNDVYMWVKETDAESIVFHELTHVAYGLLESCGISFDEELVAHLMGWLKIEIADRIFHGKRRS